MDDQLIKIAEDLERLNQELDIELGTNLPDEEPQPVNFDSSLHDDEGPPQGYSDKPPTRTIALSRKYDAEYAERWFKDLAKRNGWRVWAEMFWDARNWFWLIYKE